MRHVKPTLPLALTLALTLIATAGWTGCANRGGVRSTESPLARGTVTGTDQPAVADSVMLRDQLGSQYRDSPGP